LQSWPIEENGSSIKQALANRRIPHQHSFGTGPIHELVIDMRDNRKESGISGDIPIFSYSFLARARFSWNWNKIVHASKLGFRGSAYFLRDSRIVRAP